MLFFQFLELKKEKKKGRRKKEKEIGGAEMIRLIGSDSIESTSHENQLDLTRFRPQKNPLNLCYTIVFFKGGYRKIDDIMLDIL